MKIIALVPFFERQRRVMICCTQTEKFPGEINCMNTQELIKFMPTLESETQDCVD